MGGGEQYKHFDMNLDFTQGILKVRECKSRCESTGDILTRKGVFVVANGKGEDE